MGKKKKSKSMANQDETDAPAPPPAPAPPETKAPVDPKWKWPPFPTPPPGVIIIPFHQFEPKGIVISLDDDSEVDGEGMKTVTLQVKHGIGHRGKKGKKKKNLLEDIEEEELQKMTWDKRWELAEEMRTARPPDPEEAIFDRLSESLRLFQSGRRWDQTRQQLWDQFRVYLGVISGVKRPQRWRKPVDSEDEDAPFTKKDENLEDEDEEGEEDVMTPEPNVEASVFSAKDREEKQQSTEERMARNDDTFDRLRSLADTRTEYWTSDPETATKIFLSSYFRDRGLMWSESHARDMPIILCFYFRFVLRNKLFVEKDLMKAYEKALMVAERASIELPFTYRISRAFPDKWGRACTNLWGIRYQSEWNRAWNEYSMQAQPISQVPEEQETMEIDEDEREAAKLVEAEYDFGEKRRPFKEKATVINDPEESLIPEATIEEVEDNLENDPVIVTNGEVTAKLVNGHEPHPALEEEEMQVEDQNPKGSSGDSTSAEFIDDWGDLEGNQQPSEPVEDLWGTITVDTIADFVDESTAESIPRSYIPIRGEKSTRLVVQIHEPDETAEDPLSRTFAKLVLQPWSIPNMDADSLVQPPSMLNFGENDEVVQSSKRNARSFDATKHNIYVYAHKDVVSECRVGMAMGGTWIQVAKRIEPGETVEKPTGGKSKKGGSGDEWWYMEALDWALPGYWTNNEPDRDTTLPHNNAEYAYEYSD